MEVLSTPQPSYQNAAVLYYWKQCGPCKQFAPTLQRVEEQLAQSGRMRHVKVYHLEVMENREKLSEYKADLGDGVPRLILYNAQSEAKVYSGPRTIKAVKAAMEEWLVPPPSPVPTHPAILRGGGEPVTLAHITVDPSSLPVPSMVMYYSSTCGFCKVFIPTYLEFAERHRGSAVPILAVNIKTHPEARAQLMAEAYSDTVPHIVYHASATRQVPFKERRTLSKLEEFYTGMQSHAPTSLAFARRLQQGTPFKQLVADGVQQLTALASSTFGKKYAALFSPAQSVVFLAAWDRQARPSEDKMYVLLVPKAALPLIEAGDAVVAAYLTGRRKGAVSGKVVQEVHPERVVKKKLREGYDDVTLTDPLTQVLREMGYKLRLASTGET
jgi:thiol-disulfide isomerase/thioredoxin